MEINNKGEEIYRLRGYKNKHEYMSRIQGFKIKKTRILAGFSI